MRSACPGNPNPNPNPKPNPNPDPNQVGLPWETTRLLSDEFLGNGVAVARMRRVDYSKRAPSNNTLPRWLHFAPHAGATRLHCVLRHPEHALRTDVWGQRFLPWLGLGLGLG